MKQSGALALIVVYLFAIAMPGVTPRLAHAQRGGEASALDVPHALGIPRPVGMSPTEASLQVARRVELGVASGDLSLPVPRSAGVPSTMAPNSAFSTAVLTTLGSSFNQVSLLADWDGREDLTADHEGKVDDFSQKVPPGTPGFVLTRAAVSAHTRANGYNENVFYYGDSLGNLYVAQSPTLGTLFAPLPPGGLTGANIFSINLPTILNAFGTLNSDDQVVITGICVSPVADLTSFPNVNGAYAGLIGQIGEIVYVTFWDTGSGRRLASNNAVVRSGVLAFPVADLVSGAPTPPFPVSPAGFPVSVGASFGVAFSTFSNLAGCAVDDDGSVYFQQVDLQQFTGANIVKITDVGANQDRSAATNGFITLTTLNPANGLYGTASGPATQVNRFTNYSGTSTTFGNIAALAAGPGNALYAAVARSRNVADDAATQATEGLFANPAALGPTPSMIISFADAGTITATTGVVVPDGLADVAAPGLVLTPGVNNFRAFVLGTGPERRAAPGTPSPVFGTTADTLKLELQVDFTIYSGLMVDEERKVYVVSGGTPAGAGLNPSPSLGEVLVFPDQTPADRRADYVDLRGDAFPNPPASGGNLGDGDSDRFDFIFWQAPLDELTATPAGVAGLARGFLRYLNRTAPMAVTNLPNGTLQGDDATNGPIAFEDLDPGHQVAGGDDQNPPFRGDDSNGAGSPPLVGPLLGGFEFTFGGIVAGVCTTPWNAFFLNSNGSITFSAGDTSNVPNATDFLTGLPKIAAAWADLNPSSRLGGFLNTFPVQAVGFAGVNHFKIRWINVPEFAGEAAGSRNTVSISLFDDGTGIDENASQPLNPANPIGNNAVPFDLQEGATDLRFATAPGGTPIGRSPRPDRSGPFAFEYGAMDLVGAPTRPVLTGYSTGGLVAGSVGEVNLSELGRTAVLGVGVETAFFELFDAGDYDLRFEGTATTLATPPGQPDLNRERLDFFGKSCSAPPLGAGLIVTGAGEGGGPHVRVFDSATGADRLPGFFAYAPAFTGGVRVALADVNGDGFPDVVTGAGPGGGPHLQVFDGAALVRGQQVLLHSFLAFDPGFTGGIYVAAGDLDGDGKADIVVGAGEGGGPNVRVFSGATGAQLPGVVGSFFAYAPAFSGGVRVAVGDVNGDGQRDIITGAGPGGGPHVRVFDGATGVQLPGVVGSFFAFSPAFTGGVYVAARDFTFDGKSDVIVAAGAGGGPHVQVFSGADGSVLASFFAYVPAFTGGVRVGSVAVDGSAATNRAVLTAAGPSGGPHVRALRPPLIGPPSTPEVTFNSFFAYDPLFFGGVFVGGAP
jgi:hypothetical protein